MKAQECVVQGHELLLQAGLQGSDRELVIMDQTASIHFCKSEYLEAREIKHRMVQMTSRDRSPYFHANGLQELALIDIIIGSEDSLVVQNLSAAKEISTQLGWASGGIKCDLNRCQLDIRAGKGVEVYPALEKLVNAAGSQLVLGWAMEVLGNLSNRLCGVIDTFRWAITYFAFGRKTQNLSHTYQGLRYLGDFFLAEGDEQSALNVFQAVLDASTEMDVHRRRADCMSRIGDILLRRGQVERAKTMWEAARPLFVRSSQASDVAAMDAKLAELSRTEGWEADSGEMDVETITMARAGVDGEAVSDHLHKLANLRVPSHHPEPESIGEDAQSTSGGKPLDIVATE
jgi:hypothetical protein